MLEKKGSDFVTPFFLFVAIDPGLRPRYFRQVCTMLQ